MTDNISLELQGLKELIAAFDKWPREVRRMFVGAGRESREEILDTRGLRNYPKVTTQRKAPNYPYYRRTVGTQVSASYNLKESENLGKKWYSKEAPGYAIEIGNTATYAKWVHGEQQARRMALFGWRKLFEVAKEKTGKIQVIYQKWVNATLRKIGL